MNRRWTCKITDYGLHHIRYSCNSNSEGFSDASKLLWTAPELLRCPEKSGTQPGDIFSFAIITQEVLLQDEPYSHNTQFTPTEIIEELKAPTSAPIRPIIPSGKFQN